MPVMMKLQLLKGEQSHWNKICNHIEVLLFLETHCWFNKCLPSFCYFRHRNRAVSNTDKNPWLLGADILVLSQKTWYPELEPYLGHVALRKTSFESLPWTQGFPLYFNKIQRPWHIYQECTDLVRAHLSETLSKSLYLLTYAAPV